MYERKRTCQQSQDLCKSTNGQNEKHLGDPSMNSVPYTLEIPFRTLASLT